MRRAPIIFAFLFAATSGFASEQSYISYDDGQSVVRQNFDSRELEARVNMPVFPGDEIVTARRGRTEIRLADGNVVVVDQNSHLQLSAIANSYEGTDAQSIASLQYGSVIVHNPADDIQPLRLDTGLASYVLLTDGIVSVTTGARERDEVHVLSGALEIRTQARTYRLRAGESARVDVEGIRDIQAASGSESGFERWYLSRIDRYSRGSSRYLDSRLSYVEADLADHGSWVYAGTYGWVWRPDVSAGWRPYYNGSWVRGPWGGLVWSSYEPWGWGPYHYGRWAWDPTYGWFWSPGSLYAPAWVYWSFGPSYIGWSPIGWYSCFRPYQPWYYGRSGWSASFGVGFYGQIRLSGADLSGWTFMDSGHVVSRRVDRAALTTDRIRERLAREGDRAVFASGSPRFTKDEIRNPQAALGQVVRRSLGGGTGTEGSGSLSDLTPFFRRDPELSPEVRQTLSRPGLTTAVRRTITDLPNPASDRAPAAVRSGEAPSAPSGVIRRGGGGASTPAPTVDTRSRVIGRTPAGTTPAAAEPSPGTIRRPAPDAGAVRTRPSAPEPSVTEPGETRGTVRARPSAPASQTPAVDPPSPNRLQSDDGWRARPTVPRTGTAPRASESSDWRRAAPSRPSGETGRAESPDRTAPVPRRVIDSIGGARMVPSRPSGSEERTAAPSSERSRGTTARPSAAPRSSGTVARPSSAPRSSGTVAKPSSTPRSGGTVSRPSSTPRSSGTVSRPSSAPRSSSGSSASRPSAPKSSERSSGTAKRDQ
ncbi:MAG: DUF6600 domain-containing protein [Thermoanaerobaculia bacterium]